MNDPFFQKTPKLYNPRTLFGEEHFDAYANETPLKEKQNYPKQVDLTPEEEKLVYERYLKFEYRNEQAIFKNILNNCYLDEKIEDEKLKIALDELLAINTKGTIILYSKKGESDEILKLVEVLEKSTKRKYELCTQIPEDFKKSGLHRYWANVQKKEKENGHG